MITFIKFFIAALLATTLVGCGQTEQNSSTLDKSYDLRSDETKAEKTFTRTAHGGCAACTWGKSRSETMDAAERIAEAAGNNWCKELGYDYAHHSTLSNESVRNGQAHEYIYKATVRTKCSNTKGSSFSFEGDSGSSSNPFSDF